MTILYTPGKKIDKTGDEPQVRYHAVPLAPQRVGVSTKKLAKQMATESALTEGDALSALTQLPAKIVEHLEKGRTVKIEGLGTFYLSISSKGVESPEACKPSTIQKARVCFRADNELREKVGQFEFECMKE